MKLSFRQGLISFQQSGPAANYLIPAITPGYVTLNVSPTPFIGTVAHGSSDYLLRFDATVPNMFGPMVPSVDNYLFLQVNTVTGAVTGGITTLEPVTSSVEPISAVPGQMWFDLNRAVMRVRTNDGAGWFDSPRLVIARVTNGNTNTIVQYGVGTSVGLSVPSNPGFFMLDSQLRPLRTSVGELLTTDSPVRVKTTVGTSGVLTNPVNNFVPVRAAEPIPAMRLVYFSGEDTVSLASSDPSLLIPKTPVGVIEAALATNETGVITQAGEVTFDQWNWGPADFGKPLYCGWAGEITTTRPQGVKAFRVGHVKNPKTILFMVDAETEIQVAPPSVQIISGAPPVSVVTAPNMQDEIVSTISMLPATASQDGYMTSVQAGIVENIDARVTAAEADIVDLEANKADVVHGHAIADVTDLQLALDTLTAADLLKADKVIGAVNGNFAGLNAAGNLTDSGSKASDFALVAHVHLISEVTGLQTALNGKAALVHTHTIADVTNLQAELDGKAAINHTHSTAQVTGLDAALANRALVGHQHSIADITNLQVALNGKSDVGHAHAIAEVTGLQTALDGKAAVSHAHTAAQVTDFDTAVNARSINAFNDVDTTTFAPASGETLKWDGSNWVPAPDNFAPNYQEFVATAAQTVFNTTVATVTPSGGKQYLQVFVNGVLQRYGATAAYTVTGPNQITFNTGLALDDEVVMYSFA